MAADTNLVSPSIDASGPAPAPRHGGGSSEIEGIFDDLVAGRPSPHEVGLITVDELERRYIERVLTVTAGNKSRAAQILGFDRRTLYRKIERYGRSQ